MDPTITLTPEKETILLKGHPWVFPKAIAKITGKPRSGDLVKLLSSKGELLALGAFNEQSLYKVRVLNYAWEALSVVNYQSIITHRLEQALKIRLSLGLPNPDNNAFRLFNSEADGLSGLTIDYFDKLLVISCSAFWVEAQKETLVSSLKSLLPDCETLWISQAKTLQQDGWTEILTPQPTDFKKIIREGGLQFAVNFAQTQKTGLFLDQRENHQRLAALTQGKKVLDLYTYAGGFALHAAKASAAKVTAVDSSEAAIIHARENARLNQLENIDFIVDDARNYLDKAGEYDVVILDPPKLVPGRAHLNKAKNYYRYLHRELFKAMKPGSLLMTCNCSSALSSLAFATLVEDQGREVKRLTRIQGIYGPALCHPTLAAFPEGNYLTAILLSVL